MNSTFSLISLLIVVICLLILSVIIIVNYLVLQHKIKTGEYKKIENDEKENLEN